jgi:outer membrane receptor protein involved in Fe transport
VEGLLVLKQFRIRSGYEYVHSEVTSFSADPSVVGKLVPQTPAHVFTQTFLYSAPRGFALEALLRTSSSQFDDDQNQFPLTPYSTMGVFVSKRVYKTEVFGAVNNLFNSRIETATTPVTQVAPGRVITAGLRVQFGGR